MVNELIGKLTSELGVNESQATGGLGFILNLAKNKLGEGDFSSLVKVVPGLDQVSAPEVPEASGSTLSGLVGSALSAMGNENLGGLNSLISGFKSLNLDASMVAKFVPIVTGFFQDKGGDQAKKLINQVLES